MTVPGLVAAAAAPTVTVLASRLVPATAVGRATAVIFSAVPLGSVLGVPAGTFIGGLAGWRMSFAVLGVLALGVLVAPVVLLPPLPAVHATSLAVLRELLRRRDVRVGLLATVLVVTYCWPTEWRASPAMCSRGPPCRVTCVAYGAVPACSQTWYSSASPAFTVLVASQRTVRIAGGWWLGAVTVPLRFRRAARKCASKHPPHQA